MVAARDCARVFGQDLANRGAAELMELFARSLADLGRFIEARCGGSFEALIASANGSAGRLVDRLREMPLYRDVSLYRGLEVPLYKRAQITAWDLALAFDGRAPGHFEDLEALTIFADNLVPHVLRCEGVWHEVVDEDAVDHHCRSTDSGVVHASTEPCGIPLEPAANHPRAA